MSLTANRTFELLEKRMNAGVDSRGLILWLGPIRRLFSDLYAAKREIETRRSEEKRAAYGQLMLAESELKQLRSELEPTTPAAQALNRPTGDARAQLDSILGKIYAAKGILSCLVLGLLLALLFTPEPPELRRTRDRSAAKTIRVIRTREDITC